NASLSKQITYLSLAFGIVLTIGLGCFGWWAASRIDDRSTQRETRAISRGLKEIVDRVSVDQETSTVWDESVINLRINNEAWLAENLAEWISEYFGHDRVYILDPANRPIRSVHDGALAEPVAYEDD